MAITSSAKRAIRTAARRRVFNLRRLDTMREQMKEIKKLAAEGKEKEAQAMLAATYQAIDKAAKRGVIKKNTASRKKSRLVRALRKATTKVK